MPDAEFVRHLSGYGGIPAEIYQDASLARIFLPALRADMRIAECYTRADGPPLDCPITVLHGAKDPLVSPAGVAAWSQETVAGCEIITLPGGHFNLRQAWYPDALSRGSLRRDPRWETPQSRCDRLWCLVLMPGAGARLPSALAPGSY